MKRIMGLVVLALVLVSALRMAVSCTTVNGKLTTDKSKMDTAISIGQGLISSIQWITPVVCGFVSVAQPGAIAPCAMANASANALASMFNGAVAKYNNNPTTENAQAIQDAQAQLKDAWGRLDDQYHMGPDTGVGK